jgi:hypothetical protein
LERISPNTTLIFRSGSLLSEQQAFQSQVHLGSGAVGAIALPPNDTKALHARLVTGAAIALASALAPCVRGELTVDECRVRHNSCTVASFCVFPANDWCSNSWLIFQFEIERELRTNSESGPDPAWLENVLLDFLLHLDLHAVVPPA